MLINLAHIINKTVLLFISHYSMFTYYTLEVWIINLMWANISTCHQYFKHFIYITHTWRFTKLISTSVRILKNTTSPFRIDINLYSQSNLMILDQIKGIYLFNTAKGALLNNDIINISLYLVIPQNKIV